MERLKAAIKTWGDRKPYREIFHQAQDKRDNYPAYAGMDSRAVDYKLDYLVVRTLEEVKRVHLSEERLVIL